MNNVISQPSQRWIVTANRQMKLRLNQTRLNTFQPKPGCIDNLKYFSSHVSITESIKKWGFVKAGGRL